MNLLDQINEPNDLKNLNFKQLNELAKEIRIFLINCTSKTGGHLASNLGVVELTLAIHYVYNSPMDKLVWDVGHQSYVHKILTSRKDSFNTLRKYGGLSGFPKKKESPHDIFETGHSSTSISAILGIAKARDLKNEKYNTVAIIGDGSISNGMAFEALNDAGHTKTDLTIILNDNAMSISKNVGALAMHLAKIRSDPRYSSMKKSIEKVLLKIPFGGRSIARAVERMKNSFKYLLVPGVIFEELGFTYIGPIDGHNTKTLVNMLERAKKVQGPVLVHVITKKGKGYPFAEKDPEHYHGVSPFNIKIGCSSKENSNTYSHTLGKHLINLAEKNENIVAISAAMPDGTGLNAFKETFPNRFFDVGIAEEHAVTFAAGLATNGMRPVIAIYSTFLQRAYDQIVHDVCLQNLPVIFAIDRAGLVGADGETHQGAFDISYLRHIPNIMIMAPKNTLELSYMLDFALNQNSPVAIRYPKGNGGTVESLPSYPINDVKWEVLLKGSGVFIFTTGSTIETAIQVSEILQRQNYEPTVINARFIKPLDEWMLNKCSLDPSALWVTLEDNVISGGFGSSINEYALSQNFKNRILNFGLPDEFIPQGDVKTLRKVIHLDPISISQKISKVLLKRTGNTYAKYS